MGDSQPDDERANLKKEIEAALVAGKGPAVARFALSCIGAAVPIAGGIVGASASAWAESEQEHFNRILAAWLKLQEKELEEIGITLAEVMSRIDTNDAEVMQRVESPQYLSLVNKCFRDWSAAESEEKRVYVRNVLVNAASCRITSDDIVRLFIQWIRDYSEAHFMVIRDVYQHPRTSRGQMWQRIHGVRVREDSSEADLFKLRIRDLSIGGIIRQSRMTDGAGNFYKQPTRGGRKSPGMQLMVSAFDDGKPYELTELGSQFVHYTMNEVVPKIAPPAATDGFRPESPR